MLIVLEGCDGSGKTTLAKMLATLFDASIVHCTTKTPNDYEYFRRIIESSKTKNIIADRFCYGQFVYQTEEERKLDLPMLYKLEASMLSVNAKVIYMDTSAEYAYYKLQNRGDTQQTCEELKEHIKGFNKIFELSSLRVYRYKVLTGGIEV